MVDVFNSTAVLARSACVKAFQFSILLAPPPAFAEKTALCFS